MEEPLRWDAVEFRRVASELIDRYITLADALPPKDGEDDRTATLVAPPIPLNLEAADERAHIRVLVRRAIGLQTEARAWLSRFRLLEDDFVEAVRDESETADRRPPCPKDCPGLMSLQDGEVRCSSGEPSHTIPLSLLPYYKGSDR